ncbi:MAG: hypothetical protein IK136_02865, partial [Oscillospiraceae bacterium]|nr:hypothetical protein [Oscillospiraceae bacterium]
MTDTLLTLLNMSAAGAVVILAVMLLRLLLKRAPKWTRLVLWGLAALRLTLPFFVESPLSLMPRGTEAAVSETIAQLPRDTAIDAASFAPETRTTAAPDTVRDTEPAEHTAAPTARPARTAAPGTEAPATAEPALMPGTAGDNGRKAPGLLTAAAYIWAAGAAGLILYGGVSCLLLKRRLMTAVRLEGNVYESENVDSPFLFGLVRPKINLPFGMDEMQRGFVTAHETAHMKGLDHVWKPLGFVILALHWFNPFVWAAYILFGRDIELNCDERVTARLSPAERADYSQTLVELSLPKKRIAACPLAFGESNAKERVKNVLNYKKPGFWIILAAVAACAATALCLLTSPKKAGDRPDADEFIAALENGYSAEDAAEDGCVVTMNRRLFVSGEKEWLDFENRVNGGDPCSVRMLFCDNDGFSASDLVFDGKRITKTDYKKDGDGKWSSSVKEYAKLERSCFRNGDDSRIERRLVSGDDNEMLISIYAPKPDEVFFGEAYQDLDADGTEEYLCLGRAGTDKGGISLKAFRNGTLLREARLVSAGGDISFAKQGSVLYLKTEDDMTRLGFSEGEFRLEDRDSIWFGPDPTNSPEPAETAAYIEFRDAALAAQVRKALFLGEGDDIGAYAVRKLEYLSISGPELTDLSELALLTNLKSLTIADAPNADLEQIGGLTQLQEIDIYNCGLEDFSFLTELKGLSSIGLKSNYIKDISPLALFPKLKFVNIENNLVSDISPLLGIAGLGRIDLSWNPVTPEQVRQLREHLQLTGDQDWGASVVCFTCDRSEIVSWPMDIDRDGEDEYFCVQLGMMLDIFAYTWIEEADGRMLAETPYCGTGHIAHCTYAAVNSPEYGACLMKIDPEFRGEYYGYALMRIENGELVTVLSESFYNFDEDAPLVKVSDAKDYADRVDALIRT